MRRVKEGSGSLARVSAAFGLVGPIHPGESGIVYSGSNPADHSNTGASPLRRCCSRGGAERRCDGLIAVGMNIAGDAFEARYARVIA